MRRCSLIQGKLTIYLDVRIRGHSAQNPSELCPLAAYKLYGVAVRHPWVDVAGTVANHPRLHPWDPNNSVGE
jgi:hypothetical protein